MRAPNNEGSQLSKFHFPCNEGERWIYILSLESITSIQKPISLLMVAYNPVSGFNVCYIITHTCLTMWIVTTSELFTALASAQVL